MKLVFWPLYKLSQPHLLKYSTLDLIPAHTSLLALTCGQPLTCTCKQTRELSLCCHWIGATTLLTDPHPPPPHTSHTIYSVYPLLHTHTLTHTHTHTIQCVPHPIPHTTTTHTSHLTHHTVCTPTPHPHTHTHTHTHTIQCVPHPIPHTTHTLTPHTPYSVYPYLCRAVHNFARDRAQVTAKEYYVAFEDVATRHKWDRQQYETDSNTRCLPLN